MKLYLSFSEYEKGNPDYPVHSHTDLDIGVNLFFACSIRISHKRHTRRESSILHMLSISGSLAQQQISASNGDEQIPSALHNSANHNCYILSEHGHCLDNQHKERSRGDARHAETGEINLNVRSYTTRNQICGFSCNYNSSFTYI